VEGFVRISSNFQRLRRRYLKIAKSQKINGDIKAETVRVVDVKGDMQGVLPLEEALKLAREADLDLVEVDSSSDPPICRILDFGKIKYKNKKKQSNTTKQHRTQLKQIRLRAKTGQHDIDFKMKRARQFLTRKDKVKINVIFKGRENAHHDRGKEMLQEIIVQLEDVCTVEKAPSMDSGWQMTTVLAPKP